MIFNDDEMIDELVDVIHLLINKADEEEYSSHQEYLIEKIREFKKSQKEEMLKKEKK